MKLSDTLTGEKHDFTPAGDEVRIYVCGVTPYSSAHVGHAMSYIVFDVLHRYLEFRGYKVRRVQNFTDIDDKLIDRAEQEETTVEALAERHIAEYFANMAALNVREADEYPRATQEVPKIVEVISGLIDSGHAYESNGDVYFRVRSEEQYGKLSHRSLDAMRAGARIEPGVQKEHPMDFALWKSAKPGEPEWESPWGGGRPGWHIECSAMALRYLGESIDIHGGGQDLIFPHHENEIAQSEAFTGVRPFARFWLHNGLLNMDAQKMSKSLGNLVTISDALEHYSADAIRLSVLNAHYRSPGYYSDEALAGSERAAGRLRQAASAEPNAGAGDALDASETRTRFIEAMDDDLNSPQAVAALFDLARDINRGSTEGQDVGSAQETLRELTSVLGLTLEEREASVDVDLAARVDAHGDDAVARLVLQRHQHVRGDAGELRAAGEADAEVVPLRARLRLQRAKAGQVDP
jgi:cysteinyl-tRNA synthetase